MFGDVEALARHVTNGLAESTGGSAVGVRVNLARFRICVRRSLFRCVSAWVLLTCGRGLVFSGVDRENRSCGVDLNVLELERFERRPWLFWQWV